MLTGFLKNSGRGAALAALLFIAAPPSLTGAGAVETHVDRSRISAGETALITIKIADVNAGLTPGPLPNVPGLEISYAGMSQSVRIINMNMWRGVELRFAVTPEKPGVFTVPPITIHGSDKTWQSKPVTITASPARAGSPSAGASRVRASVECPVRSVYTGQPAIMRYYIINGINDLKIEHFDRAPQVKGFLIKKIDETIPDQIVRDQGAEYLKQHIASFAVIPAVSGRLNIGGGSVSAAYQSEEGFFRSMRRMRIQFPEIPLQVLPLPVSEKPREFSGDVGSFSISIDRDSLEALAGEEVTLNVTVSGEGNLYTISDPRFASETKGFRVLKESSDAEISASDNKISGEKKYRFTLIPGEEGHHSPGPLTITFFDPEKKRYATASTPPVTLKTLKNETASSQSSTTDSSEEEGSTFSVNYSLYITAAALTSVALLALLFIAAERRRFRSLTAPPAEENEPVQKKKKGQTSSQEKNRSAALEELKQAKDSGDRKIFLKTADKIAGDLLTGKGSGRKDTEAEIASIKEKIYSMKYGGGGPGGQEIIEEIYTAIYALSVLKG